MGSRASDEGGGAARSLAEELATALMSVHAKEELVREHARVSEEAVSGRLRPLDGTLHAF